jgi:hypothetical protein
MKKDKIKSIFREKENSVQRIFNHFKDIDS